MNYNKFNEFQSSKSWTRDNMNFDDIEGNKRWGVQRRKISRWNMIRWHLHPMKSINHTKSTVGWHKIELLLSHIFESDRES